MVSWTPDQHYKAMKLIDEMLEIEPNNYCKKITWLAFTANKYLGLSENYKSDIKKVLKLPKITPNFLISNL